MAVSRSIVVLGDRVWGPAMGPGPPRRPRHRHRPRLDHPRTIQVLPALADLPFPHVSQVWLVERYTCDPVGILLSAVAAPGVTNLPAHRAATEYLATLIRQH